MSLLLDVQFTVTITPFVIIMAAFDLIVILVMIFRQRKDVYSILVWSLVLVVLPVLGFVLYVFIGNGPTLNKRKRYLQKLNSDKKLNKVMVSMLEDFKTIGLPEYEQLYDEILFSINYNGCPVAVHNEVEIYTDIKKQFDDLINEVENAQHTIYIQYFTFSNCMTGRRLLRALEKKAMQGLKVILIIDDFGSVWSRGKLFQPLVNAGGQVIRFLKSNWMYFNRNLNYRNHRKSAIIDGKVAFTGGANIGDEYANEGKRNLPWRDTHMKIVGDGVALLNLRFLQDYAYSSSHEITMEDLRLPKHDITNVLPMQLISSGPDTASEEIKQTYMKLIYGAQKRIWLQTPYFIPDAAFIDALKVAVESGIDVRIMIPMYPDKKMVYLATHAFAAELVELGAKVYMYPAFIHSKTLLIDNDFASIGTFNLDIRSFRLHFEHTVLMYGPEIAKTNEDIFLADQIKSQLIDKKYIANKSTWRKMKEHIMRLASPLL